MIRKKLWALVGLCLVARSLLGATPSAPQTKLPATVAEPAIAAEVEKYLAACAPTVKRGTEDYYANLALDQALQAFRCKNYGIGSVVLLKWKGTVYEFRARNAMVTGHRLADHAESRALQRAIVLLNELKGRVVEDTITALTPEASKPDDTYAADTSFLQSLADGLHVYGTLEPCPMCMVMMLNIAVKTSKSLAKDGDLRHINGRCISNGAALATAEKFVGAPAVWQSIRARQGLQFCLYRPGSKLAQLALRLFAETREEIDKQLGG